MRFTLLFWVPIQYNKTLIENTLLLTKYFALYIPRSSGIVTFHTGFPVCIFDVTRMQTSPNLENGNISSPSQGRLVLAADRNIATVFRNNTICEVWASNNPKNARTVIRSKKPNLTTQYTKQPLRWFILVLSTGASMILIL